MFHYQFILEFKSFVTRNKNSNEFLYIFFFWLIKFSIDSDWIKQYLDMLHEGLSEVVLLGEVNKPNGGDEDDGCVVLGGGKPSYMCELFTNWV